MHLDEYQAQAMRTANDPNPEREMLCAALGLCGETGEFAEHIKKHIFHHRPLDDHAAGIELGDVLWYLAYAAQSIGMTLEDIARMNLEKLRKRYPHVGPMAVRQDHNTGSER